MNWPAAARVNVHRRGSLAMAALRQLAIITPALTHSRLEGHDNLSCCEELCLLQCGPCRGVQLRRRSVLWEISWTESKVLSWFSRLTINRIRREKSTYLQNTRRLHLLAIAVHALCAEWIRNRVMQVLTGRERAVLDAAN